MSSLVADLDAGLQAMLALKPPGVSGSGITRITSLCAANIQSESVLIQKLFTHFKKAPGTHKLGVLYVVDSVTRRWAELAKNEGQPINSAATDGSFAAAVHRVTELLPVLMNDIIHSAPDDQKEKIRKLVDIWEKGQTFPLQMLASFKHNLSASSQSKIASLNASSSTLTSLVSVDRSTTPTGSPPPQLAQQAGPPASAPSDTSSILAALAEMARKSAAAPPVAAAVAPAPQNGLYNVAPVQPSAAPNQTMAYHNPSSVIVPVPASFAPPGPGNGAVNYANPNLYTPGPPQGGLDPATQQQIMLIKTLADSGMDASKIAAVLAAMGVQGLGGIAPQLQGQGQPMQPPNGQNGWGRPEESHDQNGYENNRSSRFRRRSRSPSPARQWGARDSPNAHSRRDESNAFGRDEPRNDRGRGRDGYRERSPPRRQRSPSPRDGGDGQRWIGHDDTLPQGSIRVLSRTLFVGGVTCPEYELRSAFEKHGRVQTCIVNKEKRHAFVKMFTRKDSVAAKEGMERNRAPDSALRTRWGVGFGPRECSDYATGISVIPIEKLTDADRKWMTTAENGGTGGKILESGMVVEEPDIEIGQGVSSKAISRRMGTDQGGKNGPKSGRNWDGPREDEERNRRNRNGGEDDNDRRRARRDDGGRGRRGHAANANAGNAPPSFPIPGFPMGFPTMANGMPMIPPGFVFPGQQPQQPPAPGR